MPFPQRLLYDDETVALDLRPHWWYFSRHILTGVPLLALVIGVAIIPGTDVRNVLRWPVAALVLVWAAWLGSEYLRWLRTSFVVTDQRVLYRAGVLARHGVEIPLDRIANINYHQGIWERIIGAGDLDIESAGEEGDAFFRNVRHPDDVQNEIYQQMEGVVHRNARAGADVIGEAVVRAMRDRGDAPGKGSDVAAKVEQLARLRDEGHISPDEFERRKNRLLDQF
jgi:membrane protein YdbS with pleckstrin-like domain